MIQWDWYVRFFHRANNEGRNRFSIKVGDSTSSYRSYSKIPFWLPTDEFRQLRHLSSSTPRVCRSISCGTFNDIPNILSPLAYCNLLQTSKKQSTSTESAKRTPTQNRTFHLQFWKPTVQIDNCEHPVYLSRHFLWHRLQLYPLLFRRAWSNNLTSRRPFFRLPLTSLLAALDYSFVRLPDPNALDD